MTIQKFKEKFEQYWPTSYDAVICPKCKKDLAFYDSGDDGDDPFRDRLYMNDAFYNDGGDAIYCCNHCMAYVGGKINTYTDLDTYIEDQKKMIKELDMLSEESFKEIWKEGNDGNDGLMYRGQYTKFILAPMNASFGNSYKLELFRRVFINENIGKTIVITNIDGDFYIQ